MKPSILFGRIKQFTLSPSTPLTHSFFAIAFTLILGLIITASASVESEDDLEIGVVFDDRKINSGESADDDVDVVVTDEDIISPTVFVKYTRSQKEEIDLSRSLLTQSVRRFAVHLDTDWALTDKLIGIKDQLEFWSSIEIDAGRNATDKRFSISAVPAEGFRKASEEDGIITFSSQEDKTLSRDNRIALSRAGFSIKKVKNFTATEIPPALKITVKSWLNDSQGGSALKDLGDSAYNQMLRDHGNEYPVKIAKEINVNIVPHNCENIMTCKPNLEITDIHLTTIHGQSLSPNNLTLGAPGEMLLEWTIENKNTKNESAVAPGALIKLHLDHNGTDLNMDYNWPLLLSLKTSFPGIECDHEKLSHLRNHSWFWFHCNKSMVLLPQHNTTMKVKLNLTGIYPRFTTHRLIIQINATHAHHNQRRATPADARDANKKIELHLFTKAKVDVDGVQRSSLISYKQTSTKIIHSYNVSLLGESPVDKIELEFYIPLRRESDAEDLIQDGAPTFTQLSPAGKERSTPMKCLSGPVQPKSVNSSVSGSGSGSDSVSSHQPTTETTSTTTSLPTRTTESDYSDMHVGGVRRRREADRSQDSQSKMPKMGADADSQIELSCSHFISPPQSNPKSNADATRCKRISCSIPNVENNQRFRIDIPLQFSKAAITLLQSKVAPMSGPRNASASSIPNGNPVQTHILIRSAATAQILRGEDSFDYKDKDISQDSITVSNEDHARGKSMQRNSGAKIVVGMLIWMSTPSLHHLLIFLIFVFSFNIFHY